MPTSPTLVEFNVKNVKATIDGTTMISLTGVSKIAVTAQLAKKIIYNDGNPVFQHLEDKERDIELDAQSHQDAFDIALGYKVAATGGTAELRGTHYVPVKGLYCEVENVALDKTHEVKKVWFFNINFDPADPLNVAQNAGDISEQSIAYKGVCFGTNFKDSTGTNDVIDSYSGEAAICYHQSAVSADANYATFGETLPTPKAAA